MTSTMVPSSAPTTSKMPSIGDTSADDEGTAAMCDMIIYMYGCNDVVKTMASIATAMGLLTWLVALFVMNKKRILLPDNFMASMKSLCKSNSKHKITPPQVLLMSIPFYSACLFIGLLVRSLAMYSDEPPGFFTQFISAYLTLGLGANGFTYCITLYIVYWLQILEVKKEEQNRKKHTGATTTTQTAQTSTLQNQTSAVDAPTPRNDTGAEMRVEDMNEAQKKKYEAKALKAKKMAEKMLKLMKMQKKIVKGARYYTYSIFFVAIIPAALQAAAEPDDVIRQWMLILQFIFISISWGPLSYILLTSGYNQCVAMEKKHIMQQYYTNTSILHVILFVALVTMFSCLGVFGAEANQVTQSDFLGSIGFRFRIPTEPKQDDELAGPEEEGEDGQGPGR
eukprot:CAMPEP_0182575926 /NCGR_PEP_ID=MMETSP1324-20130603/31981_1 /TAXON_ID=236786 /ORGANISM="Florenciella sp., Strain RCC1587" /LENGTH=394 /DNA_ID=CAMNT_0024791557 /DNA_START=102 /DNA_END=1285 /DNA_ORIENTATION=-